MLALANPSDTQPHLIPGLKYSAEWHREQDDKEQAWLDEYVRCFLKFGALPVDG